MMRFKNTVAALAAGAVIALGFAGMVDAPMDFRSSSDANAFGDMEAEIRRFLELGMDGFFTDQPNIGVRARATFVR